MGLKHIVIISTLCLCTLRHFDHNVISSSIHTLISPDCTFIIATLSLLTLQHLTTCDHCISTSTHSKVLTRLISLAHGNGSSKSTYFQHNQCTSACSQILTTLWPLAYYVCSSMTCSHDVISVLMHLHNWIWSQLWSLSYYAYSPNDVTSDQCLSVKLLITPLSLALLD